MSGWRGGVWSGGLSGPGGVCLVWGGLPGQVLPPVNRMTHRCKNITLAKTSFRPVTTRVTGFIPANFLDMKIIDSNV